MPTPADDLFAFLEADIDQVRGTRALTVALPQDPARRALELATPEWSEQDAGAELARLWGEGPLRDAQQRLLRSLSCSPFVQVRAVRAARIIWSALDQTRAHRREPPSTHP